MQISISARNTEVPESVRERTEKRLSELNRHAPRATRAAALFEFDHGIHRAEVRLNGAGPAIVAHGAGENPRMAVDQAIERLARQLRRRAEQARTTKLPRDVALMTPEST